MKISTSVTIVTFLSTLALGYAGTSKDYISCPCTLIASSQDDMMSCSCVDPAKGGGTDYTGHSGRFHIDPAPIGWGKVTYSTTYVYLTCPHTSQDTSKGASGKGYVTSVNFSGETNGVQCGFSASTFADQGYVKCTNMNENSGQYFNIDSYTCTDYHVSSYWKPLKQIESKDYTYTATVGTSKSTSISKTSSWTDSVTTTVKSGLEVDGIGASGTMSTTISTTLAETDSNEWTVTTTTTSSSEFTDMIGKEIWQWVYVTVDPFGNSPVQTFSDNLAITGYKGQPPQCIPGNIYGHDYANNSQVCCDMQDGESGCLPGATNCTRVPASSCNAQATAPETATVTAAPTSASTTASPTASPTAVPTSISTTTSPTTAPTDSPTAAPTDSPTAVPTDSPTAAPTDGPTAAPTDGPTASPTANPSTPGNPPDRRLRGGRKN